jgi:glucose/arabinose dehydrogenase
MFFASGAPRSIAVLTLIAGALALAGCSEESKLPESATTGSNPVLQEPDTSYFPRVNIAKAVGWPEDGKPTAASNLKVAAFAEGLDHPRWLYVLPNGDVLVAETNGPEREDDNAGFKGWFVKLGLAQAGAAVKSANRITLLRDADRDGVAETRFVFLENLNSPFGMELVGNDLYVADTDALLRFPYVDGETKITAKPTKVADLPAGKINHHWTKNVIASPDGQQLYVTVGSNSNIGENGMENEVNRAAILQVDPATGKTRLYASGLRNPNGLAWQPQSGELWTVVNERDGLGNNLVPDYMTSVKDGGFYGWPYSYYGDHVDKRVRPQKPELVEKAIVPDYALGAHTASLGLTFYEGDLFPARYRNGAFIGQHGSWNRNPRAGYKVIFVPFANGRPSGQPEDVLTGFVNADDEAQGRPVGVAVDQTGALLVADDVGNTVWRVTPGSSASASLNR